MSKKVSRVPKVLKTLGNIQEAIKVHLIEMQITLGVQLQVYNMNYKSCNWIPVIEDSHDCMPIT